MGVSISVAILTYAHPDWLEDLLRSLKRFGWPPCPVRVFRDGPGVPDVAERTDAAYQAICSEYGVPLVTLPEWGCIQANAQQALEQSPEDWVFILQDDNLATPGCIEHIFRTWEAAIESPNAGTVGLLMPPFWHMSELIEAGFASSPAGVMALLDEVPVNPGWGPVAGPRLYIGAHGSSFILNRQLWAGLGGFSQETWCYDEDISCKIWCYSARCVYQFNGPPFVHGKPGLVGTRPQPAHTFGLSKGWVKAWRRSRDECNRLQRESMRLSGDDGCLLENVTRKERGVLQ